MNPQISSLKKLSLDLVAQAERLLTFLRDAEGEANRATDSARRKGGAFWARQAIENITADQQKLKTALLQKNPTALTYSAGEFAVLGRYVNDYDYSWFSRRAELAALITTISDTASPIVTAIDVFDAANLEEVRRALA